MQATRNKVLWWVGEPMSAIGWKQFTYLQGQGKYKGMSLPVTLLPVSLTIPDPTVLRTLSGAEHMNRWPLGHSYSTPINIFTTNSAPSEIIKRFNQAFKLGNPRITGKTMIATVARRAPANLAIGNLRNTCVLMLPILRLTGARWALRWAESPTWESILSGSRAPTVTHKLAICRSSILFPWLRNSPLLVFLGRCSALEAVFPLPWAESPTVGQTLGFSRWCSNLQKEKQ